MRNLLVLVLLVGGCSSTAPAANSCETLDDVQGGPRGSCAAAALHWSQCCGGNDLSALNSTYDLCSPQPVPAKAEPWGVLTSDDRFSTHFRDCAAVAAASCVDIHDAENRASYGCCPAGTTSNASGSCT